MKTTRWIPRRLAGAALLAACCLTAQAEPLELSGTLKKVKTNRSISLGYRAASLPFSYLNQHGEPIGYSIELCRAIVDAISDDLGLELNIKWVPVTPDNRLDAVASGKVDLECGSTTSNLERQQRVAFSPIIFIAGTKLLVKQGSPIRSYRDLADKTVAVTSGTTNETALRELAAKSKLKLRLLAARDHDASFQLLKDGKADAFATDDVLLYGLLAQHKAQQAYSVVGEFLSYDPYGLMYAKHDAPMAEVVERTLRELAESGEIERSYKQWFQRRLPSGEKLNVPMSAQLAEIIRMLGRKPE